MFNNCMTLMDCSNSSFCINVTHQKNACMIKKALIAVVCTCNNFCECWRIAVNAEGQWWLHKGVTVITTTHNHSLTFSITNIYCEGADRILHASCRIVTSPNSRDAILTDYQFSHLYTRYCCSCMQKTKRYGNQEDYSITKHTIPTWT